MYKSFIHSFDRLHAIFLSGASMTRVWAKIFQVTIYLIFSFKNTITYSGRVVNVASVCVLASSTQCTAESTTSAITTCCYYNNCNQVTFTTTTPKSGSSCYKTNKMFIIFALIIKLSI